MGRRTSSKKSKSTGGGAEDAETAVTSGSADRTTAAAPSNSTARAQGESKQGERNQAFTQERHGQWRTLVACAVTVAVCITCYSNATTGNFVFDDMPAIVDNADVDASKTSLASLFSNNFWGQRMDAFNAQHQSYRPLTTLSFRIEHSVHGMEKEWFHTFNIIFHTIASCLVVVASDIIVDQASVWELSLIGSLFASHPVHVEAVTGLVGRAESLSAIFFLLSFIVYAKACHGRGTGARNVALSLFFALCALLCKEQGITVVAVCVTYELVEVCDIKPLMLIMQLLGFSTPAHRPYLRGNARVQGRPSSSSRHPGSLNAKAAKSSSNKPIVLSTASVTRLVALVVCGGLLMAWRASFNAQEIKVDEKTNPSNHIDDTLLRFLTKNVYAVLHAWLLLYPNTLCCDWSGGSVALVKSLADPRIAWIVLLYATLASLIVFAASLSNKAMKREYLVSLAIVVAAFIPASGLFMEVGFVLAERVLYLPSIGYCIFIVVMLRYLAPKSNAATPADRAGDMSSAAPHAARAAADSKDPMATLSHAASRIERFVANRRVTPISLACVVGIVAVALFSARTFDRNKDWESEIQLYKSGLLAAPNNEKLHHNAAYYMEGKEQEFHFREAIRLYPPYISAYTNLGVNLARAGRFEESIQVYLKGIQMHYKHPIYSTDVGVMYRNLGQAFHDSGDLVRSLQAYRQCLRVRNTDKTRCHNMIAYLEGELKRSGRTVPPFQEITYDGYMAEKGLQGGMDGSHVAPGQYGRSEERSNHRAGHDEEEKRKKGRRGESASMKDQGGRTRSSGQGKDGGAFEAVVPHVGEIEVEQFRASGKGKALVLFYAPWCSHCREMHADYIKVRQAAQGVAVIAVDCTQHEVFCEQQKITGYPTIRLLGKTRAGDQDYAGDRSAHDILRFLQQ